MNVMTEGMVVALRIHNVSTLKDRSFVVNALRDSLAIKL